MFTLALSRCKSKEDAEDVCQEVFVALLNKKQPFKNNEHMKAWLIKTTIDRSKNTHRYESDIQESLTTRLSTKRQGKTKAPITIGFMMQLNYCLLISKKRYSFIIARVIQPRKLLHKKALRNQAYAPGCIAPVKRLPPYLSAPSWHSLSSLRRPLCQCKRFRRP